jgi:hypothetical protein
MPPHPENYAQCRFPAKRKLLCEAASGFFVDAPGKPRTAYLPSGAIAALGRLGFSTDDSEGNFRLDIDVSEPPDFTAIAELMPRALHDAYGAGVETKLGFHAPYARRSTGGCVPGS